MQENTEHVSSKMFAIGKQSTHQQQIINEFIV